MSTATLEERRTARAAGLALGRQHGWEGQASARLHRLGLDIAELRAAGLGRLELQEVERLHHEATHALAGPGGPDFFWPIAHRLEERVAAATHLCPVLLVDYVAWAMRHLDDPLTRRRPELRETAAYRAVRSAHKAGTVSRRPQTGAGTETAPTHQELAEHVCHLLHEVHVLQDEAHGLRNEQNSRLKVAARLAAGLSLLTVVMSLLLDQMPFLVGAESFADVPRIQVVALVVLGGLVGGSWGAFPALMGTLDDRYRTQRVRALVRVSMGVLAALIGTSLIGSGWADDLTSATAPTLFAVAVAFGLTQEPVTRILEAKAGKATGDTDGDAA